MVDLLQTGLDAMSREELMDLVLRTNQTDRQKNHLQALMSRRSGVHAKLETAIASSQKRASKAKTMDVCFAIDCTASMASRIDGAKSKIREIQNCICEYLSEGGSVRFAVIGYRDYQYSRQSEVLKLSEDVAKVEAFLQKLTTPHPGPQRDVCEDVMGGLEEALRLEWQAATRILYLLCDAPAHGSRFHCLSRSEDHFLEDPKQWAAEKVFQRMEKLQLHFVGMRFDQAHCAKMFEVFQQLRLGAHQLNLHTDVLTWQDASADFATMVLKSASRSITASLKGSKKNVTPPATHIPRQLRLEVEESVSWAEAGMWPEHKVLLTSLTVFGVQKSPTSNSTVQTLRVRPTPFGEGNMRYAFPALRSDDTQVVLKVDKSGHYDDNERVLADVKTQAYAQRFAIEFSKLLPHAPLQFLDIQMVALPKWPYSSHATLERLVPGSYEKYTNNWSYVAGRAEVAEALSHFSWFHSGGDMMVSDIQGVGGAILTDPQIHTASKEGFGRGNLGTDGMDQFFLQHRCNSFCRRLGLKKSPLQLAGRSPTSLSRGSWSDVEECPETPMHQHQLICHGCCTFVQMSEEEVTHALWKYGSFYCQDCGQKVVESSLSERCSACKREFQFSVFGLAVKGCAKPEECPACTDGECWMLV
ncbi:unnamed protein product [Effrenium voratum]|uniref:Alpha-type protein kinase domain-containing protein n=1 Tax=Effrenium voratum TaxID=2562239 RepID=A0AA36JGW1_9DINO|nr:unnamed protein product [Effrenium voratum]